MQNEEQLNTSALALHLGFLLSRLPGNRIAELLQISPEDLVAYCDGEREIPMHILITLVRGGVLFLDAMDNCIRK